jgi:hypothetical protein
MAIVGILWFGRQRSTVFIPTGAALQLPREAAVKGGCLASSLGKHRHRHHLAMPALAA